MIIKNRNSSSKAVWRARIVLTVAYGYVKDIRRQTRKRFSSKKSQGRTRRTAPRGQYCGALTAGRRRTGFVLQKEFLEAGKKRSAVPTARAATRNQVNDLRREALEVYEFVAEKDLGQIDKTRYTLNPILALKVAKFKNLDHLADKEADQCRPASMFICSMNMGLVLTLLC